MAKKISVLVVDDDINFADSTIDLLNEKGFDSICAYSGKDGIVKAKEKAFDVILMDMKMPVMNGVETYREIKKISPKTVVIMITAYRVEDLIRDGIREGAYGLVRKPLDIDIVTHLHN